jgi:hypothetical protein
MALSDSITLHIQIQVEIFEASILIVPESPFRLAATADQHSKTGHDCAKLRSEST